VSKPVALRGLFLFSAAGLLAELLLSKHWEGLWQVSPLVLLAVALLAVAGRMDPRLVRGVMALVIVSGLVGTALHYKGKIDFARERSAALTGWALVGETLKGTSPPILAPGAMIAIGLLGLIVVYRDDERGTA